MEVELLELLLELLSLLELLLELLSPPELLLVESEEPVDAEVPLSPDELAGAAEEESEESPPEAESELADEESSFLTEE